MLSQSVGDLVQTTMLTRRTASVSANLARLADEIASGQRGDLQARLSGNFAPLAGIERDLSLRAVMADANAAAARFAAAQQAGLDALTDRVSAAAPDYLTAASAGSAHHLAAAFRDAESALDHSIDVLNTRIDGRALFAGQATEGAALDGAQAMLAALGAAVAAETTAADVMAAADTWFDPGGPFETVAYLGSLSPLAPLDIGENATEQFTLTAADPTLRETLKAHAVVALMGQGLLETDPAAQVSLLEMAGERLLSSVDDLNTQRAEIGFREQRIEVERVRGEARRVALEEARSAIADTDPYEAATRFQQVETQLSAIFQITARLSTLSLVSVLR